MAITDVSQEYEDNLTAWEADRDFVKGDIAVKAGGQTYLPKIIADQTDAEYAAYLARGLYPGLQLKKVRDRMKSTPVQTREVLTFISFSSISFYIVGYSLKHASKDVNVNFDTHVKSPFYMGSIPPFAG